MAPRAEHYEPIPGSERPQVPGSTQVGPVEAGERVSFTLLLRRKPGSPEPPDLQHWQDTTPDKREFLSPQEFFDRHGSAQGDVDSVVDYLKSRHLRVVDQHAGRGRIQAEGTAADVNSAFGITLMRYRAPARTLRKKERPSKEGRPFGDHLRVEEHVYRGFEGPAQLPPKLAEIVIAVVGLDNRRLGTPAGAGTGDPPGAGYLSPLDIAQRYNFPATPAAGQTIGIFEAADAGAAYLSTDITAFLQSLPGGAAFPLPNLTDVLLLGNTNNPALVTNPPTGAVFECTIDVAIAAVSGAGANINVYFTDGTEAGWEAFFNRAIFPLPGDNPPAVLTASWVPYLSDDAGTIGLLSNPASPASILHHYLRSAAVRGISVLMAIGDWGSDNLVGGVGCHLSYPNCDPWVTSCGGTILGAANPIPPPLLQEWTWSDANLFSLFDSAPYDATGGGVSDTFPRPPYQVHAGVLPISKNDGNIRRGVPDVAGMVAMSGFFLAGIGGPGQNAGFGTSAVSPLYAGLVATINAFLGRNVGFLNPTLYKFGPEICNDITIGNNDSGNLPDSPFYTAAIGWDPCTGWGSLNGIRLMAAVGRAPLIATSIADSGAFCDVCVECCADEILTINNTGFNTLLIWGITSSLPDFETPLTFPLPLSVGPGDSIDLTIRFRPTSLGVKNATITIFSNSLLGPQTIAVSGTAAAPSLALAIADKGSFGSVCVGSFRDEPLILNNNGKCKLLVSGISSSSVDFLVPEVLFYPLSVGGGDSLALPIRFAPTSIGPKAGTLTVFSNDPMGPRSIQVFGDAPAGRLVVTGSTFFGGIKACCRVERTISLCNVGDCKLYVASMAFKHPRRCWKLINNPFPATLHPGSCLSVVIRYFASERFPRPCELVITSDDPIRPVITLEVVAATVWDDCGCGECCDECRKGSCEKKHCDRSCCAKCTEGCDDDDEDDDKTHRESGHDD